jgi:GMP synthase (glutamine-hydrolysing)
MRLLVLDAYAREGRAAVRGAGGTEAGKLYEALLLRLAPDANVDVAYPADGPLELPSATDLDHYAGVVWTGSSLTIHHEGDARVTRQIELAREIQRRRIPGFGSCWAAQLATVATGGRCAPNPRGREFGVSREIALTEAGRAHPMYRGKPARFDALTSHADHVVALGPKVRCLASNDWSPVQAVGNDDECAPFWAVQYHPEYDLHEVASLARLRKQELVDQGTFSDLAAAERVIADLEELNDDPLRDDLKQRLGVDASVLDPDVRTLEVRNWLASLDALRRDAP